MIFSYKSKLDKGRNVAFEADKEGEFIRTRCGKLFSVDHFKNVYLIGTDREYCTLRGGRIDRGNLDNVKQGAWFRRPGRTTYFGTRKSNNIKNAIYIGDLHKESFNA